MNKKFLHYGYTALSGALLIMLSPWGYAFSTAPAPKLRGIESCSYLTAFAYGHPHATVVLLIALASVLLSRRKSAKFLFATTTALNAFLVFSPPITMVPVLGELLLLTGTVLTLFPGKNTGKEEH